MIACVRVVRCYNTRRALDRRPETPLPPTTAAHCWRHSFGGLRCREACRGRACWRGGPERRGVRALGRVLLLLLVGGAAKRRVWDSTSLSIGAGDRVSLARSCGGARRRRRGTPGREGEAARRAAPDPNQPNQQQSAPPQPPGWISCCSIDRQLAYARDLTLTRTRGARARPWSSGIQSTRAMTARKGWARQPVEVVEQRCCGRCRCLSPPPLPPPLASPLRLLLLLHGSLARCSPPAACTSLSSVTF